MRVIKKVINIALMIIFGLIIYSTVVNAAKVTVNTETLFLREKASTESAILTMLGEDDKCELLGETGDWYKVKFKDYTGYISKDYALKEGETKKEEPKKETVSKEETSKKEEEKPVEQEINKNEEVKPTEEPVEENTNITETKKIAKLSKKVDAKILPLINSNTIDILDKGEEVTIIENINGWLYVGTDEITAWIRADSITNTTSTKKEDTNKEEDKKDITDTEKTMYVNDEPVNLRKSPNTDADVVMVVSLNTKLTVVGEEGDWYKVKTSEGNAYVSKELLSDKEKTTTSRGKVVRSATQNLSDKAQKELTEKNNTTDTNKVPTTNNKVNTANSAKGSKIVSYAKKYLGVPYVYGGASSSGFDCSGYTMYVYKKYGISLPHGAEKQSHYGNRIKSNKNSASSLKNNLKAGDIVFFLDYETMDEIGHCGIYIGNGKFIHASSGSGYCVKIDSLLPGDYYNTRYCGATRLI